MSDPSAPHCDRHPEPVRMLSAVVGRWPQPQLSGGISAMNGTNQTVWTCPTCRRQTVTSP